MQPGDIHFAAVVKRLAANDGGEKKVRQVENGLGGLFMVRLSSQPCCLFEVICTKFESVPIVLHTRHHEVP